MMNTVLKLILIFSFVASSVLGQNACGLGSQNLNKILGGIEARNGDWGWQVIITYNGYFLCSGSLVNDQWIVTTASCVYGRSNPAVFKVDIGVHNRFIPNSWTQNNLKISKIIVNSLYNPNTFMDDIALIKLTNKVYIDHINYNIIPVCLPNENDYRNESGYTTGWGALTQGGGLNSVKFQVELKIPKQSDCQFYYHQYNYFINPNKQFCAGVDGEGKGLCAGDTGNPLVVKIDNKWTLLGLNSFGVGCDKTQVFVRVENYLDWIQSNIKDEIYL